MGSSIDVSSTGQLVNRLMNPPDMGAQFAKGLETLNAWKQFQANQASADAYKQSVDPVTGEVDLGKYKSLLSQGPGAWAFGPLVTSGGQAVGAVGQGTTADINAKMRQIDATGQMMFPLLRDGAATQSIDPARVQAQLDQAHATHLITDQQYNAWSSQLKGMDAKQAYGFVLGANEGNEGARAFLQPSYLPYGSGTMNVNPASPGGRVPAGGNVPYSPTPGEQISQQQWLKTPYSWYDSQTLQYTQGTYEQFLQARGANPNLIWQGPPPPMGGASGGGPPPAQGAPAPAAPTPSPAPAPAPGGGRGASAAPPAAAPAPAPAPRPAPTPSPAPGAAGKPATLPPPSTIKTSEDTYNAAQANQEGAATRVATLQRASDALQGASIGPGTEGANYIRGLIGNWTPEVLQKLMPGDQTPYQTSTDYQELHKYLQGVANSAASTFGGGATNDKLAATIAANPNVSMNNVTVGDMLKVLIANERVGQYLWKLGQDNNIAPAAYGRFTANWLNSHDVRAFAYPDLTPKAQATLAKSLVNKDGSLNAAGKKLNDTVHELVQARAIPDPTKGAAAPTNE